MEELLNRLIGIKPDTARRFLRFALVGGTTGSIYAVVVYLAIEYFLLSPTISGALGYLASVPMNFAGHKRFAFRAKGSLLPQLARYGASTLTGIGISAAIMHFSIALGIGVVGGIALTILTIPIVTFLVFDNWVFRTGRGDAAVPKTGVKGLHE